MPQTFCVISDLAPRYYHCLTVTDSGLDNFNFKDCLSCKMSGSNAKMLINWHTGWLLLGEKDANGSHLTGGNTRIRPM